MKIKIPKEVREALNKLKDQKFQAYLVGGAVRDSIAGRQVLDWDLATNAPYDKIVQIFPESKVLNKELTTFSLCDGETCSVDLASYRVEKEYSSDGKPSLITGTDSIEEDLKRRDFTVNAIAYSPEKGLVDPFNGVEDIKDKIIRPIGDPDQRFSEDPIRIMRGIRIAAECNFDIEKALYESMLANVGLLANIPKEKIQDEFEKIIMGENAGKGLRTMIIMGILPFVLGENCYSGITKQDEEDLKLLADNFNKVNPDLRYKYALILRRLKSKAAEEALDHLTLPKKSKDFIHRSLFMVDEIYFLNNKIELKQFICKNGMELYDFLDRIARQEKKVLGREESKVESRHYMLKEIKAFKEPVCVDDLAISGDDLINGGIAKEGSEIGEILEALLNLTIRKPRLNEKQTLLKEALSYKRSPLKRKLSKINWLK